MDLINAQAKAKADSKKEKDTLYYVILEEDEFEVLRFDKLKDSHDVYSVWRGGVKIESPNGKKEQVEAPAKASQKSSNNQNSNIMKKTAKKSAAKKSASKKTSKGAGKKRNFTPGKIVSISIADMRKNLKKGYEYRDPQGVIQTEKYMATRAKQDHVREGMHEYKPEKKA